MHITDKNLKLLIDVLAERLDDDKDMLSDCNALEERATVEMVWKVEELLEELRQEQRSRTRGGTRGDARVETPSEVQQLRAELGAAQATVEDLLAQSNDHREQLNALRPDSVRCWTRVNELEEKLDSLGARDPDVMFWGRIKAFERKMEKWAQDVEEVLEARTANSGLQAEALLRLTTAVEDLHRNLQALELQSDDRWVRTQQMVTMGGQRLGELENQIEAHVGEGEVRH